jgi:NADH-quinone oxidoreductase subunit L
MTFLGQFRGTPDQEHHLHESPSAMTIPLIVLAILSVIGGFVGIPEAFAHNAHSLAAFLDPVIVKIGESAEPPSSATEFMLMAISVGLAVVAIIFAWSRFIKRPEIGEPEGAGKFLADKWYVDELYDKVVANPMMALGGFLKKVVEKSGIDAVVNGVGRGVNYAGRQIRLMQSGQVGNYILLMVLSMVLMIILVFYGNNLNPILKYFSK